MDVLVTLVPYAVGAAVSAAVLLLPKLAKRTKNTVDDAVVEKVVEYLSKPETAEKGVELLKRLLKR
jgi:hypothetical protein